MKLITGCHAFRRASGAAYLDEALEDAAVRLRDVIHRDVTSADVKSADVTSADVTSADVASADDAVADDAVADVRRDVTRSSSEKDPRRALSDAVVAEVHTFDSRSRAPAGLAERRCVYGRPPAPAGSTRRRTRDAKAAWTSSTARFSTNTIWGGDFSSTRRPRDRSSPRGGGIVTRVRGGETRRVVR